jgi:hypothetical protein
MPRKTSGQLLEELLERHDPVIQQAFLQAVSDLRNSAVLRVVAERLERGDVNGALAALNIEPEAFSRVEVAILEAYNDGGRETVGNLPKVTAPDGSPVIFRWGVRNLPAEMELRQRAAELVSGITEDQRDGIREVLTDGLARGQNPWKTAREIVGKRSRANNERVGGYLGLTSQQIETTAWIRRALAEGDKDALRRYLDLKLRDKRFDKTVAKAIRDGAGLSAEVVDRIAGQYANRALDYRGRVLSRHETMMALSKSQADAFRQQIDAGKVDQQDITKTWKHTPRENPRQQHVAMHGQTVAFAEPFVAPDGTTLRYPHDPEAPARHTLNCMCRAEYSIDFTAGAVRRFRARTAA